MFRFGVVFLLSSSIHSTLAGTCNGLEQGRLTRAGNPIVLFGATTFVIPSAQIWITLNLKGFAKPGSTNFFETSAVLGVPGRRFDIPLTFDRQKKREILLSDYGDPNHSMRIHFNQLDFIREPELRFLGLPIESIDLRFGGQTLTVRGQDLRAVALPVGGERALILEGPDALVVLAVLRAVDVPMESLGANYFGRSDALIISSMVPTKAARLEGILNTALDDGTITPAHPIFSFPPIAAIRSALGRD